MWYTIIVVAVVIVAALAFYAGQLLWQVKAQKKQTEAKFLKRINFLTDSIRHIAQAMEAEQCEFSEGVLRIWVLLDHYKRDNNLSVDYAESYPGFSGLYEVIKDMPTHEARKKLGKKEMMKLDMQRWQAEKAHQDNIKSDIKKLLADFAV